MGYSLACMMFIPSRHGASSTQGGRNAVPDMGRGVAVGHRVRRQAPWAAGVYGACHSTTT
jgi:hypothetical protein